MSATHMSGPLFVGGLEIAAEAAVGQLPPDDVTLEEGTDVIQVKAGGIDTAQLADGAVNLAKLASEVTDLLDLLSAIPTADQNDSETIWNDGGVLKVSSAP